MKPAARSWRAKALRPQLSGRRAPAPDRLRIWEGEPLAVFDLVLCPAGRLPELAHQIICVPYSPDRPFDGSETSANLNPQ